MIRWRLYKVCFCQVSSSKIYISNIILPFFGKLTFFHQLLELFFKAVGDVFQKNQAKDYTLVFGSVYVPAQDTGRISYLLFKADVCCDILCHDSHLICLRLISGIISRIVRVRNTNYGFACIFGFESNACSDFQPYPNGVLATLSRSMRTTFHGKQDCLLDWMTLNRKLPSERSGSES